MSAKSPEGSGLWEFGEFRLDGRARLLLRDGIPVPLTPKALEVLLHLVRHAGRTVSREELLDAVWPDTIVTDASLTQAVFLVRKALGETETSNFVETVPKFGYRFNLPDQPVPLPAPGSGDAEIGVSPVVEPAIESPETGGTGRRRRPSPAILAVAAAGALVAAAVIPILLRSQATGGSANPVASSAPPPLLALDREIAVPPDALRILGAFDGTVVLSAPSAFYLLPSDGAISASRVSLAPGEVAAAPLGGGRLLVLRDGRVVARHPSKPEESDLGPLPADAPKPAEARVAASRSGRYLAVRGDEALDVFERTSKGWERRVRARVPYVPGEAVDLGERYLALAQGAALPVRAWSLPEGAAVLEAPFSERQVFAVSVDDARGMVAVGGPFDTVAVFSTSGPPGPRLLPRRGWTYGLAWVSDAPDPPRFRAGGTHGVAGRRRAGVAPLFDLPGRNALPRFRLPPDPRAPEAAAGNRLLRRIPAVGPGPGRGRPLWAAEHDAEGKTVFTGGGTATSGRSTPGPFRSAARRSTRTDSRRSRGTATSWPRPRTTRRWPSGGSPGRGSGRGRRLTTFS